MSHADKMAEFSRREKEQLAMGGANKLAARRAAGKLNVRERLEIFFDPGTFREIGVFSRSSRPEAADRSPTDGKIIGSGKVEGRSVLAVANDMTVLGASSAATNMKKIEYIRSLNCDKGLPLVFLGESTGARIPDSMGALGMAQAGQNPAQYRRLRQAPWISALLGPCYGSSAWYTAVSDVSVMLKGAVMAVSSPKVTKVALGEETDPQELGGLKLHSEVTGMADLAAESEEEALGLVRRTLSFLPTHAQEPPPLAEPAPPGGDQEKILDLLPQESHQVYEVRKIIRTLADKGEFLELKPKFARPCVTALARLEGRTVGLVANNPAHGAGALTADCCDKVISFLVLCDSFNIPLVMLVDTPGFLIGKAGERQKVVGRIMNWMNALSLVTVPIVSVIYGQKLRPGLSQHGRRKILLRLCGLAHGSLELHGSGTGGQRGPLGQAGGRPTKIQGIAGPNGAERGALGRGRDLRPPRHNRPGPNPGVPGPDAGASHRPAQGRDRPTPVVQLAHHFLTRRSRHGPGL